MWLVAETAWREEVRAHKNLTAQRFQVLLPLCVVKRTSRGNVVTKELPLFSGYIFVEYEREDDRWKKIQSTRGIKRVIAANGQPVPLRHGEAERLAERCASGPFVDEEEVQRFIKAGETGRIVDGTFAGHLAVCQSVNKDFARLELTMFRRRTLVDVPREWVAPVDSVLV